MATKSSHAGISSDAVLRATGRSWSQWLTRLDAAGAAKLTHKQIAAKLSGLGVAPWWSQMITVGYEQARGRRVKHQKPDGFSVSASRTVDVPVSALYTAWADESLRARWLGVAMSIRTCTRNRSIRAGAADGGKVDVNFYAKGRSRSMVQVEHSKLATQSAAQRAKSAWTRRLERLSKVLDGVTPAPRKPTRPRGESRPPRRASRRTARS